MSIDLSDLIACHGCDLLVNVSGVVDGERAYCPRCGQFLTLVRDGASQRVLAYSISSLILLALACVFPFLSFAASGLDSVMTLPQTALELYREGMPSIAFLVAAFILFIPLLVMLILLSIYLPLHFRQPAFWLVSAARWFFSIFNWAMVEVFIIGVIVSLVKISSMADLTLGLSFWAYAAFSICFTLAVTSVDRYQCWKMIEQLESGK